MHQQSVVLHCAGVGVVAHACHEVLLIWARAEDHHHRCDPPGHPRDELQLRRRLVLVLLRHCSPLQVMN